MSPDVIGMWIEAWPCTTGWSHRLISLDAWEHGGADLCIDCGAVEYWYRFAPLTGWNVTDNTLPDMAGMEVPHHVA